MTELVELGELIEIIQISPDLLALLEEETIICPQCIEGRPGRYVPKEVIEEVRIAKVLMEDLGVNVEGIDIILRLRRQIIEMQKQFQAVLKDLREFVKTMRDEMP